MRRILTPLLLLAVALGALAGSNYMSDQLHENIGEVAADDSVPPGVGTPLVSTLRLRELLTPSLTEPDFFTTLDSLMATAPSSTCLSVTLDGRGPAFYESGDNIQVTPSNALVLLTLATAHEVLGPEYTFTTSVQSTVPMDEGVVNGDIYLVGGGDPLLFTDEYLPTQTGDQVRLHTAIDDLAQRLVDDGLTLVTGAVVGDTSRYDDLRYVPTWPESLIDSLQIGTLLALQLDDGWVQFPTTGTDGTGEQNAGEAYLAAESPPFYAGALFDDMLEARDVVIRRSPRAEAVPDEEEVYVMGLIESAPLSDRYEQILGIQDIETIELLLKEIGLVESGIGSTSAGVQAVANTLDDAGIDVNQLQLLQFDGSGLDPASLATCPLFTSLLDSAEFSPLLREFLPTAAEAGPLRNRFAGVSDPGRIKAYSGGTSNVTSMMGYIDIGLGQEVTFAFIANHDDIGAIRELEEQVVRHLATLAAKPTLDDIDLQPIQSG